MDKNAFVTMCVRVVFAKSKFEVTPINTEQKKEKLEVAVSGIVVDLSGKTKPVESYFVESFLHELSEKYVEYFVQGYDSTMVLSSIAFEVAKTIADDLGVSIKGNIAQLGDIYQSLLDMEKYCKFSCVFE